MTTATRRIHWLRVVLGALLLEAVLLVTLVPIGEIFGSPFAIDETKRLQDATAFFVAVPVGCFVFGYLVTMWLLRPVSSRFVLHGALIGVVATAIYMALAVAQPGGLAPIVAGYGPPLFYLTHALRIAGCAAAGAHHARRHGPRSSSRPGVTART
jgi:hypothetical protein